MTLKQLAMEELIEDIRCLGQFRINDNTLPVGTIDYVFDIEKEVLKHEEIRTFSEWEEEIERFLEWVSENREVWENQLHGLWV